MNRPLSARMYTGKFRHLTCEVENENTNGLLRQYLRKKTDF